jgi:hypothetical protein
MFKSIIARICGLAPTAKATAKMHPDHFLQMTFLSSRLEADSLGFLYRLETRVDDLTGLRLTRRSRVPTIELKPSRVVERLSPS